MLLNTIAELIADRTGCEAADISETSSFKELGIDSLFMILLSLAVEEKFQIRFPNDAPAPVTVGEVCEAVLKARA